MTRTIIALTIAAYLFQRLLPETRQYELAIRHGVVPALWSGPAGEIAADIRVAFTAVSTLFIHGGALHLFINMLYLWVFGDDVESGAGPAGLVLIYLGSGLAGTIGHTLSSPASTIPAIGASGAIAGVLGAYAVMYPGARVMTIVPAPLLFGLAELPAVLFVFVWFSVQLLQGVGAGAGMNVSWWAHIGGVLTGMVAGVLWRRGKR